MADIRTQALSEPVDVAEYLFNRIHQCGVRSVHGVPGDYNLLMLDYVPKAGLKWVGNCNELNAAYAADGYARVNGMGAVVTTFGVGELSAINGVAGCFSEKVPVVHIVGCPPTTSQATGMLLHHTLGNGDFNVFANMSANISVDVAKLNHPSEIAEQIDHALRECWIQSRPVYIQLPTDNVGKKVEGARLKKPIDFSEPENDPAKENYVVDVILRALNAAQRPVALIDVCAIRNRVIPEILALVNKIKLPVFGTPMGKGAIDESHELYNGTYAGAASPPEVRNAVEGADLVLTFGQIKSDFNTGGFSYHTSQLNSIDLHSTHTTVRYSEYPGVGMRGVLRNLAQKVDVAHMAAKPRGKITIASPEQDHSQTITHQWLWPTVSGFLRKGDVVVTETGTSNFGILSTKLPQEGKALAQILWGSIGWATGALQGAALAVKDSGKDDRTMLFIGDGSLQLSAQEISTMLRRDLHPIIFCICNEGYTIERYIHGMDAEYNDVMLWDYKNLPAVFGAGKDGAKSYQVRTRDELLKLFADEEFNATKKLQFVEVYMPKKDAPAGLIMADKKAADLLS